MHIFTWMWSIHTAAINVSIITHCMAINNLSHFFLPHKFCLITTVSWYDTIYYKLGMLAVLFFCLFFGCWVYFPFFEGQMADIASRNYWAKDKCIIIIPLNTNLFANQTISITAVFLYAFGIVRETRLTSYFYSQKLIHIFQHSSSHPHLPTFMFPLTRLISLWNQVKVTNVGAVMGMHNLQVIVNMIKANAEMIILKENKNSYNNT